MRNATVDVKANLTKMIESGLNQWMKTTLGLGDDERPHCLLGWAFLSENWYASNQYDNARDTFELTLLARAVRELFPERTVPTDSDESTVTRFNDTPETRYADVVRVALRYFELTEE